MNGELATSPHRDAISGSRIHWHRTLAVHGSRPLELDDLEWKLESRACPALHCLLVDCSKSMLTQNGLARVKGLLLQLIQMAYEQRDEVAIVGFSGKAATMHLAPTLARPITSRYVEEWLQPIRGSGATPFAQGVATASGVLARAARLRPQQTRCLWLLTDGRTLESPPRPRDADDVVIVDCDRRRIRLSQCRALARQWQADYRLLAEFIPASIAEDGT